MSNHCGICDSSNIKHLIIQKNWSIFECKTCYNAFTYPTPDLPDYENEDFHQPDKNKEQLLNYNALPFDWKQLIDIQKNFINKYVKGDGKILEIGCGEGLLLNELKKNNFELTGIEASQTACERAKKKGLHVVQGYFEQIKIKNEFDCIIMSQVLEHIPDINNFIAKITKLIPNGMLLLTQTNYKGLIPKIQKENWYAWVPEQHYWHFTLKGLSGILKKHGFKILDYQYSSLVHPHDLKYKLAKYWPFQQDQFTAIYKQTDLFKL